MVDLGHDFRIGWLLSRVVWHQKRASWRCVERYVSESGVTSELSVFSENQLAALTKSGLLRGSLNAKEQLSLISGTDKLADACENAVHVQECVPENPDLKKKVFASIAAACNDHTVICSSTSCLMPSLIFSDCGRTSQVWLKLETSLHDLPWIEFDWVS